MRSLIALIVLALALPATAQDHGLKVPPGFKVTLYADHTLANDIYCMTLDEEGQVIVASRGWVKRLIDKDGDGKADGAIEILEIKAGALGLCVDKKHIYMTADGFFQRIALASDGERQRKDVERIIPLVFNDHGGHAMRKGPDGRFYLVGGNDAGIQKLTLDSASPIKNPEAGGIVRFSRDLKSVECIAQGFRNPYDFDFTPRGDIITYDSDTERDFLLPWYSPTRMYHIAHGQHHGWRLPGYMRSLARPGYYADTVDVLAPIGRGSPTGVTCYRHVQFPKHYHGGVFACDWTFGKIWFLPLEADGSTYKSTPEVFLEPSGIDGFAPTDACVAPDGSLFVSIGGRGTRGAVYRIEYVDGPKPKRKLPVIDDPEPLPKLRSEHQKDFSNRDLMAFSRALRPAITVAEDLRKIDRRPLTELPRLDHPIKLDIDWPLVIREKARQEGPIDIFDPTWIGRLKKDDIGFVEPPLLSPREIEAIIAQWRRPKNTVAEARVVFHELQDPKQIAEALKFVLTAPQPLDAWSRAEWEPLARKLGDSEFCDVVVDEDRPIEQRVRAIEIMNDLFEGLPPRVAAMAIKSRTAEVRARAAWSIGRDCPKNGDELLLTLTFDPNLLVRIAALNALGDIMDRQLVTAAVLETLTDQIRHALGRPDKRERLAAARLFGQLDRQSWKRIVDGWEQLPLATRLAFAIADHRHGREPALWLNPKLTAALDGLLSGEKTTRLDALRLLMLIDGDWCLRNPPEEVSSAYAFQKARPETRPLDGQIRAQLRKMFPTGDRNFDQEAARYFAMIEDDDPATITKINERISKESSGTDDIHHLIVLSRLKGKPTVNDTKVVVDALLGLEKKLAGQQLRIKQNWGPRLSEIVFNLLMRYPKMTDAMVSHPNFVNPAHIAYTVNFSTDNKIKTARLFLAAARKDGNYPWSAELVELLSVLPPDECRPDFRKQWSDYSLRDAILRELLESPEEIDRGRFLDGLDSPNRGIVLKCAAALQTLPSDMSAKNLVPVLRRLRLGVQEPKERDIREKMLALAARQSGQKFDVREPSLEVLQLKDAYEPVFAWFDTNYPNESKLLRGDDEDVETWKKTLAAVPWDQGNIERGLKIFNTRSCTACHTGASRIGPDLTGAGGRFSRDDLFTAIISPSRDVAPAFRVNDIETQDGKNISGIVVFESADGVIVQLDAVKTVRIDNANIASRQPGRKSLMPTGLLKELKPDDLADLYAYLRSLK